MTRRGTNEDGEKGERANKKGCLQPEKLGWGVEHDRRRVEGYALMCVCVCVRARARAHVCRRTSVTPDTSGQGGILLILVRKARITSRRACIPARRAVAGGLASVQPDNGAGEIRMAGMVRTGAGNRSRLAAAGLSPADVRRVRAIDRLRRQGRRRAIPSSPYKRHTGHVSSW
jgi:hypothetical protein